MTRPILLLRNIQQLGRYYCLHHLEWDRTKLAADWFEALKFFFTHSFMRGRRDKVSNQFYCFTIDTLQHDLLAFENGEDAYRRLQERASEFDKEPLLFFKKKHGLGRKTASKHASFEAEIAATNEVVRLLTTPKTIRVPWDNRTYSRSISLGNDEDVMMVLDTLKFIAVDERQNIYAYLLAVIRGQGVKAACDELKRLRAVKDKIAPFVIRDIGLMNPGLIQRGYEDAFPVDTWVEQVAKKIGCAATTRAGIKEYFIGKCLETSIDPLLVAAGLWYLGFQSLDILMDHYLGEYDLANPYAD